MDFDGFKNLIDALGDGDKNTAAEVRFILDNLIQNIYLPGDIKMVLCTDQDLIDDYTATGLGIGKRAGWAQCNGLNGTIPFGGRTPIGFSDVYNQLGFRGGEEKHKLTIAELPKHKIKFKGSVNTSGGSGSNVVNNTNNNTGDVESAEIGGDVPHSIMQPFVVVLYLVKLP